MLDKLAGLPTQIRQLEKRLKDMDASKVKPALVKEITDTIQNLKNMLKEKVEKREQRKKDKELKEKSNEKTNKTTSEKVKEAPKETVATSEPIAVEKESTEKQDIVEKLEKDPKIAPGITKYNIDDKVMPVRGEKSVGRVMRHDSEDPSSLVYVYWDEGPLSERDKFGGYYQSDLKKYSEEEPKPKHPCPCWEDPSVYCPKCKTQKTSDLKSNYMDMLQDLKDEYSEAVAKADYIWVARLEQKIKDLEKTIQERFGKEAEVIDHPSGTERLTVIDQTPPGDKANYGPDGKPSESEYMNQLALPDGRSLNSALKVNVFNRDWHIEPVKKESAFVGYDVKDNEGRKVMYIKPASGKEWSEAEIKAALQHELTQGFKQAKLVKKIAFLDEGTKVVLLATSKDKKQAKFASIEHGVRGWTPFSNIKILATEGQSVAHEGHQDKVLAIHATETLVECPVNGVHWEKKEIKLPTHYAPMAKPPATPESLNPDVTAAKDCPDCHGNFVGKEDEKCPTCGRFSIQANQDLKVGDYVQFNPNGPEYYIKGEEFPNRWILIDTQNRPQSIVKNTPLIKVDKEALKTALPPTIPNQRGYLDNPPVDKQADEEKIEQSEDDVFIQSEGPLGSETVAYCLRKPIAKLKNGDWNQFYMDIASWMHDHGYYPTVWQVSDHGNVHLDNDWIKYTKSDPYEKFSSLNKSAIIVKEKGKWCVRSPKNKNWNGGCYPSRGAAEKRLKEVEVFKHMKGGSLKPFSKKAEVMLDPYQALTDQVSNMRSRMDAVKERLASNPMPKEADGEGMSKTDLDVADIITDLELSIDLLETKTSDDLDPDIHFNLEMVENLLWEVEQKIGAHPDPYIPAYEQAEPEHETETMSLEPMKEETTKEAAVPTSPVSPSAPGLQTVAPTTNTTTTPTPTNTPDVPSCALCGGLTFTDFGQYQNHMEYTHASDIMPTSPSQKNLPTVMSSKKKAFDVTVTDETIEDQPTTPPPPTIQNVQPVDDDNLEIPTQMPTSIPPPGTKWTWDAANGKFVVMTDPSLPGGKII